MPQPIDPRFTALPYKKLGEIGLTAAQTAGAEYADFRFEKIKSQQIHVKDAQLESNVASEQVGYAINLIHDGSRGFAASVDLSPEGVKKAVAAALEVARISAPLNSDPVKLAAEPPHSGTFVSEYEIDPFSVSDEEKITLLTGFNNIVLAAGFAKHVDFNVQQVLENKYFVSTEDTETTQQRVRLHAAQEAMAVDEATGAFESMRTILPPVGRGWEYLTYKDQFKKAAEALTPLLEEKMAAPSVKAGTYDLVIDPSNLWLTIHESIGHATELDRVLGYEANYAGTSFATLDQLNKLQYGSKVMNVTGDRTVPHGLATAGWDDEGVATRQWDLIKNGRLVSYQLNRQMAEKQGFGRSNGCAFADSPFHIPLQRMANVSLQPGPEDLSTQDLISRVKRGIYIVGDKSWSIDMQRYNFQFTGQRFYEIRDGKIAGQIKDVAYQATTTNFWNSLEAVGGKQTYVLGGAFNCGKGQPGQVAPVSHGCPAALFRNVNILSTTQEKKA